MPTALHSANRARKMEIDGRGCARLLWRTRDDDVLEFRRSRHWSSAIGGLLPTLTPAGRSSNEGLESFSLSDRSRNCAGAK